MLVVAPLSGRLVDRFGVRVPLVAGLAGQAIGLAWIALLAGSQWGYLMYASALIVAGCGVTMAMPAVQAAVLGSVEPSAVGKASGTLNTLRQLGGVFGIAVLAVAFTAHGSYADAPTFRAGFAPAIGVAAGMSLVGALIGLAMPRRPRIPELAEPEPAEPEPPQPEPAATGSGRVEPMSVGAHVDGR